MKNILFLSANPSEKTRLSINDEIQEIRTSFAYSPQRGSLKIQPYQEVKLNSLLDPILAEHPDIVHFSGHGHPIHGITLNSNNRDKDSFVPATVLGEVFSSFLAHKTINIRCVVLNSCYSEAQAKEISSYVPYVIGTTRKISDKDAILFSSAFYKGIASTEGDIHFAYNLGKVALKIKNKQKGDEQIPLILLNNDSEQLKEMQKKIYSQQELIDEATAIVKQSIQRSQESGQKLAEEIDSRFQDICDWFTIDKKNIARLATDKFTDFETPEAKKDFTFEFTRYLNLISICLVTERKNVLFTPDVNTSHPKEKYIAALKHVGTMIPYGEFKDESVGFLKDCITFLIDRL